MQKKTHCICIIFFPDKKKQFQISRLYGTYWKKIREIKKKIVFVLFFPGKNVVKFSDFFCHQQKKQFQISIWHLLEKNS